MPKYPLVSEAAKRRWQDPEYRKKQSEAASERDYSYFQTPERQAKRAQKMTGRTLSVDVREKIARSNKGLNAGEKNGQFGKAPPNKGVPLTIEQWVRSYEARDGYFVWYGAVTYPKERLTEEQKAEARIGGFWYGNVKYKQRSMMVPNIWGPSNHHWKGGITTLNHAIRDCKRGLEWRDAVFARDGYKCRITGKGGKNLRVHHIVQLKDLIALYGITTLEESYKIAAFWDLANGVTMRDETHRLYHKLHGRGNGR